MYEQVKKGVVRRTERRCIGVFIDGTGLDRACRRLKRRVDLTALVSGVASGATPQLARYYTMVPYEDDSRQWAFLEAVQRANVDVVVKRLPPKGIERQVSVDPEMSADIVAFAAGRESGAIVRDYEILPRKGLSRSESGKQGENSKTSGAEQPAHPERRVIVVVCPGRDLSHAIGLAGQLGADTITADFGSFTGGDILRSAAKWVDLTDSETIWLAEA